MRALLRYSLAPLAVAVAILSAGTPAAHLADGHVSVADISVADISCPAGTHWDHTLLACVSN